MLRLSKKMLFAIESVLDIAYHSGAEPVQSREITRRQSIPRRYLEQALQQLVREDILIGVRGPRGGYRLARERRRISIGDIVRAVRKMETTEDPLLDTEGSELGVKVVRPLWLELQDEVMNRLDNITIDQLCAKSDEAGIVSEGRKNLDFTI
ncbi:RrF2 family transcriptional regulator [Varunaivibrio sulfuroxidans]|uniref:BadM/Rrf2 family transcriptional regulator n=1 Tax=Varunaivibrio sulfuroxidans TaxID=1773489 RepID=A0A4R3JGP1_9PROT|nr:Rrf2 family transcriptional regulator [Varunaivibrio sulfuroxidans]TCS65114.1 BadM/Rrf2 family transcriptional regulator [Varunaivibrio sulfuroxidans]WES29599.1 Rrf2 family transcriptional regulator [Varunaivibrio sulfuroxidans]